MRPLPELMIDPLEALRRWPAKEPVLMLHSGGGSGWGGWSILARSAEWVRIKRTDTLRWSDVRSVLDACAHRCSSAAQAEHDSRRDAPPFTGGWIGAISYELGEVIEPVVCTQQRRSTDDPRSSAIWPLLDLAWCEQAIVFDHAAHRWWCTETFDSQLLALLHDGSNAAHAIESECAAPTRWHSSLPRAAYERGVQRILDYIAAGDVFQVNLAQMLELSFTGDPRILAACGVATAKPRYGAYLELLGDRRVISLSPELFLAFDLASPQRSIITRPIKGTLPSAGDRAALLSSVKDEAELTMIIDLMRNDLGRICDFGSVITPAQRIIETHPTVHHGVGEVHGRLRDDVSVADIIKATFPPGSITGAPKIRAMQIIRALEPVPRNSYCGAIGFLSRSGRSAWNVAIRTLALDPKAVDNKRSAWRLRYGAGAGIVADSTPGAEYDECMVKAEVLRLALAEDHHSACAREATASMRSS